jgi:hypothetical protein
VLVKEVAVNPFVLSLRLTGFEIRESDQSALLGFDEFFVNFQTVSLFRRAYVFDTIRLTLPFVSAKVSKEGSLNLVVLVPPDDKTQPAPPPQPEKTPADVPANEIGEFEIAQGIVEFRDESKPEPYALEIVPIHIVLKNFHTKPSGDNSYAFTAELVKDQESARDHGRIVRKVTERVGRLPVAVSFLSQVARVTPSFYSRSSSSSMMSVQVVMCGSVETDTPRFCAMSLRRC